MKLKRQKSKKARVATGSMNNSRTYALYQAGLRLLAMNDFDVVSVSSIAKEAECSVGAFYERFPDKNAYLVFLIKNSFRAKIDRLEKELPEIAHRISNRKAIIGEISKFICAEFSSDKTAGVIRAALKLAPTHPKALEPIIEYRSAANENAYESLKPYIKARDAKRRIEEALQLLFAVIFDAIQQNYGPLQLNNARIGAVFSNQFEARISDKSKLPAGVVFNSWKTNTANKSNKELMSKSKIIEAAKSKKSRSSAGKTKSVKRKNVKLV